MAKNDLGISFEDSFGGDVLIDTDTGGIIKNDSDIMTKTPPNDDVDDTGGAKNDDSNLINIPDDVIGDDVNKGVDDVDKSSDGENPNPDDDSSSLPYIKVLVNALHEKGILSDLDEHAFDDLGEGVDETDKLFELIKNEIDKNSSVKFDEKIKDLPDDIKKMVKAGGVEAQAAPDILNIRKTVETLKAIDDTRLSEDEDLQKNIISESLKQKGYSDERIKKRITQFEDLGALEEEAKDALSELTTSLEAEEKTVLEEARKKDEEAQKARDNSLKSLKKDIFDSSQIIEGMKLTDKEKEIIFDSMTKVVDKDTNGNPMNKVMVTRSKNPIAFEKALHYYHALGLFNIDEDGNFKPDLSKIKSSAKASAVDELSKVLKAEQRTQTGRPARENKMDSAKLKERINRMKQALPL